MTSGDQDTGRSAPPKASLSADLNLRLLGYLIRYVVDHFGSIALDKIADDSGVLPAQLRGATSWVAFEQFEAILASARSLMRDDDEFREACAYRLGEVSGVVRLIIGALSPADAYELGARNMRLISTISAFKPERQGDGRVLIRYETSRPESRLMCLSRQAQIRALPAQWGLPPALLVEQSCVAHGDACCSYLVRVYAHRRWLPAVAGAALGGLCAVAAHLLGAPVPHLPWALPVLGTVVGYLLELRRSVGANRAATAEMNTAYLEMARDDARARGELFDLNQRQTQWTHLVEQQVALRANILERFVNRLGRLMLNPRAREKAPLAALRSQVAELRTCMGELDLTSQEIIAKLDDTVQRLDAAMDDLVDLAADQSNLVSLLPQVLDVEPLVGELRNRLSALVHGRDIRVSVFAVREAPAQVRADVLLFNRIIDNLLTNAARRTERGSIIVEIGGRPGFLSVKTSDMSRGLTEAEIERIFQAEPSMGRGLVTRNNEVADLWMVAHLLKQLGGQLEVKSTVGKGSTFWAHFPVDFGGRISSKPPARVPSVAPSNEAAEPTGTARAH